MKQEKFLAKAATLANLMLVTASGLCLLVLLYFFYYYTLTGQREFADWKGVVIYYAAPLLAGGLLLASLRLPPVYRINLALSLSSAAAAILFLEVAAGIYFKLPSTIDNEYRKSLARVAEAAGTKFDTRSKAEVIQQLRNEGTRAIPSIYAQSLLQKQSDNVAKSVINLNGEEVVPLAGISNRLTVACNETGKYLIYTSDKHGFSNPRDAWERGSVDVVGLGDSFVHGYCVEPELNFMSGIRKQHPGTLSLGTGGNGPLVMLGDLKEYASVLKPKVVLWFYFEGNDVADLMVEMNSPVLRRYLKDGFRQKIMERQKEVDQALDTHIESVMAKSELSRKMEEAWTLDPKSILGTKALLATLRFSELRTRLGLIQGVNTGPAERATADALEERAERLHEVLTLLDEILVEAKRATEAWGGKMFFVYLPSLTQYRSEAGGSPERDRVLQSATMAGLPIIDIHQTFRTLDDPLSLFPFRTAAHYNEEGQRLVAGTILRTIGPALNQPAVSHGGE